MKTSFIFTVDVETRTSGDSIQDVMGILPGCAENAGIGRMMDLLEAHQAKGTFFFNVYEVAQYGEGVMASAVKRVHTRGHDVELHTHPQPMYRYYGMAQAPLEDQILMLQRGMSLIESWTGKAVVAHRAGAFAANRDTLRAARAVGLLADCSLSPGSRVPVRLVSELSASNVVQYADGVWEIPATYYEQVRFGSWHSRRILDIEGSSLAEIKHVVRWAIRRRLPTVCILLHSFSFLRHGRPNRRVIRRVASLLEWLRQQDEIQIETVDSVCRRLGALPLPEPVVGAPVTGVWMTWGRAVSSWNDGWKNFVASVTGIAALVVVLAIVIWLGRSLMKF